MTLLEMIDTNDMRFQIKALSALALRLADRLAGCEPDDIDVAECRAAVQEGLAIARETNAKYGGEVIEPVAPAGETFPALVARVLAMPVASLADSGANWGEGEFSPAPDTNDPRN